MPALDQRADAHVAVRLDGERVEQMIPGHGADDVESPSAPGPPARPAPLSGQRTERGRVGLGDVQGRAVGRQAHAVRARRAGRSTSVIDEPSGWA